MTVQTMLFKLAQIIDPRVKSDGSAFTVATIGTVDGERFSKERLMDIYNDARFALVKALENGMTTDELTLVLGATVVYGEAVSFTSIAGDGVAPVGAVKPAGLITFLSMFTPSNVPMILLPMTYLGVVKSGTNPQYTETASQVFVFETSTGYVSLSTNAIEASTYTINYLGLSAWDIDSDLEATETINEKYYPILLELAQAISQEQGNVAVNQLATKLLGGQ